MYQKSAENSYAEYWTQSRTTPGKVLTIRRSKSGSPHICLTCTATDCEHVKAFSRQIYNTPEPWETGEGLITLGSG